MPVDPVVTTECQSRGPAADIGTPIDPAVLDGTYRTTFTEQELLDIGAAEQDVKHITGAPWTITLDGGHYSDLESDCTATYRVSRAMISFRWDPGVQCSGNWSAHWKLSNDGLRFTQVQSAYAATAPSGAFTSGCGSDEGRRCADLGVGRHPRLQARARGVRRHRQLAAQGLDPIGQTAQPGAARVGTTDAVVSRVAWT